MYGAFCYSLSASAILFPTWPLHGVLAYWGPLKKTRPARPQGAARAAIGPTRNRPKLVGPVVRLRFGTPRGREQGHPTKGFCLAVRAVVVGQNQPSLDSGCYRVRARILWDAMRINWPCSQMVLLVGHGGHRSLHDSINGLDPQLDHLSLGQARLGPLEVSTGLWAMA